MLDYLSDYTIEHFQTEEKIMLNYNYPKYEEHKALHDGFVKKVDDLINEYKTQTSKVNIAVNVEVYKWLIQHIMRKDKELAQFLNKVV